MSSTYATVIIDAADKEQASADLGDDNLFTIQLSETGDEPVTQCAASGWFLNSQLDYIANQQAWPRTIFFGTDLDAQLAEAGLRIVITIAEPIN